jgi:hypothetical protein
MVDSGAGRNVAPASPSGFVVRAGALTAAAPPCTVESATDIPWARLSADLVDGLLDDRR